MVSNTGNWPKLNWMRGLLTKNRHYTHPIKEDVKKKFFSVPLEGHEAGSLHPALPPLLEGLLVLPLWIAAYFSGDANPS